MTGPYNAIIKMIGGPFAPSDRAPDAWYYREREGVSIYCQVRGLEGDIVYKITLEGSPKKETPQPGGTK